MSDERSRRMRWRLVLGEGAEDALGGLAGEWQARDAALAYLYDREYGAARNTRMGAGSLDPLAADGARLDQPGTRAIPAARRSSARAGCAGALPARGDGHQPDLLSRAQPSPTLLKAVLRNST